MVNKDLCDSGNIKMLLCSCSSDLELLTIECRLHSIPREFTLIIITAVYIPPQVNTQAALSDLCKDLNCSQTSNPDAALILAVDFNQVNLSFINTLTVPQRK